MPATAARSIPVSEVRDELADVANRVSYSKERIILTRRGREVAVLVPLEDLEVLEALEDHVDVEAAEASRNDPNNNGEPVSWKEIKRDADL